MNYLCSLICKIHIFLPRSCNSHPTVASGHISGHWTQFSSVQFSHSVMSCVQLYETPWTAACQASLFITNSHSLLKLMFIKSVMHPTIASSVIPFSSAFNLSQHQSLFQWVGSLHQVAKVLATLASASASVPPMNIQDWFPLGWTDLISSQSKGLSGVFSNTTVQKHQFFSAQPSLWSNSHIHTWLLEKP